MARKGSLIVAKLQGPVASSWASWWVTHFHMVVHE